MKAVITQYYAPLCPRESNPVHQITDLAVKLALNGDLGDLQKTPFHSWVIFGSLELSPGGWKAEQKSRADHATIECMPYIL